MSKRLGYSLRLGLSLVLLAVLATKIDLTQSVRVLATIDPFTIVLTLLTIQMLYVTSTHRWKVLLRCNNTIVEFNTLFRIIYVTGFIGMFLPGGLSQDAVRVAGLARYTSDLATSFSSVLVDRLFGTIALALVALLGLAMSPLSLDPLIAVWAAIIVGGVPVLLVLLTGNRSRILVSRLIPKALRQYVVPRLEKMYACLDQYRAKPGTMVLSFGLALAVQLLRVALVVILAWGLALEVPASILLVLVPVVNLIETLPISVGGLGVREVGFVYFLGLTGVPPEQAFALSILLYSLVVISALPGALLLLRQPKLTNANGKV